MLGVVTKIVRGGLGLALSFWIAGAGCMFGCQNMSAIAATSGEAVEHEPPVDSGLAAIVSGDACAASGSHDCCAKKKTEARAKNQNANKRPTLKSATLISQSESLNTVPSSGGRECPLALSRAIAIAKRSDSDKQSATPAVIAVPTLAVPIVNEQHFALSRSWHLPNRGHTYLRCCVFLI
jgi:hypothetical protein